MTEATWAAWQSLDDLERGQGAWEPQRCAACALSGRCRRETAEGPEGGYCAWYEDAKDEGKADDGGEGVPDVLEEHAP